MKLNAILSGIGAATVVVVAWSQGSDAAGFGKDALYERFRTELMRPPDDGVEAGNGLWIQPVKLGVHGALDEYFPNHAAGIDKEALFERFRTEVMRPPIDGLEARIVKWTKPVNVGVQGTLDKDFYNSLPASLADLSRRIGHPITMDRSQPVDVAFLFSTDVFEDAEGRLRPEALRLMRNDERRLDRFIAEGKANLGMGCHNQNIFSRSSSAMGFAVSFVSTRRPQDALYKVDQRWCFWTYMLESLGFAGPTLITRFSGESQEVILSRHAVLMNIFVRFLYRQDVLPGMTASEVKPLFFEHLDYEILTGVLPAIVAD